MVMLLASEPPGLAAERADTTCNLHIHCGHSLGDSWQSCMGSGRSCLKASLARAVASGETAFVSAVTRIECGRRCAATLHPGKRPWLSLSYLESA